MTTSVPNVGDLAPDFTLTNTHGTPVTLSKLRGMAVLVVFFPFAFSRICHGELCALRDSLHQFDEDEITIIAISTDPMYALKAWSEQERYRFDLLSDFWPHGDTARSYGVFDENSGIALRGSFLIDRTGQVAWRVVNERSQPRSMSGYLEAVAQLR